MSGFAEVVHRRILVHFTADAMTGQVAYNAAAVALRPGLDRMTHVAQPVAGHCLTHTLPEALFRNFDEPLRLGRDLADSHGKRAVRLPAVQHQTAIDADDGSFLQNLLFGGNPVHHLVVNGRAERGRIAAVVQEGRNGVVFADKLLGIHIKRSRTHPRLYSLAELLQHLVEECARFAHFPDLIGVFDANHRSASRVFRMF